jgi:hypothetical protein
MGASENTARQQILLKQLLAATSADDIYDSANDTELFAY